MLLTEAGSLGVLQGHVARANPVWEGSAGERPVLAIFSGPDRYISPSWYPSKQEHGKVVPTWNYLVVHARGKIRWKHDPVWLKRHVEKATDTHEYSDEPWHISDAPSDFVERMLKAIVGFEIEISELRGKWKISQNRSNEDQDGVIAGLKGESNDTATEMVTWMEKGGGAT